LKKILLAVLLCVLPVTAFAWTAGKAHKWGAIATHGGAAGALDTIAGASIYGSDTAHVVTGTTVYSYYAWVAGATSQANEPWIVCPDDLQLGGHGITGTTLWVLADSGVSTLDVQHKIYVAGIRWDNGAGLLNGENIADDTIDDDSIDFTDVTLSDFTNDENYLDKDTDTYLAGTTNHAALHNSGGDWELNHDNLAGFVASEHLDWTADQGATNIHADNIPDLSAVYEPEGITAADIDDLNVGTDITADLEEETHATEHESGGADEMQLSDMASGTSDIMDKTGDAGMIANWNTAYGWGDHGAVGYLTGTTDHHVLHEAGGAWELDIANLASGTSKVYDKSTDVMTTLNGTAWRVFYTDAAGDLTELALGANGEYLKSQGNAAAPTWDTPAGGGGASGAGVTQFNTDDGNQAESFHDGDGGTIYIQGDSGISTMSDAGGGAVTVYATERIRTTTIGYAFIDAWTGDTGFLVCPFDMTMTGVSIISFMDAQAGITFYKAPHCFPAFDYTNEFAGIGCPAGTSVYSISGTTAISAGDIIGIKIDSLITAGASMWTVQIHGVKN